MTKCDAKTCNDESVKTLQSEFLKEDVHLCEKHWKAAQVLDSVLAGTGIPKEAFVPPVYCPCPCHRHKLDVKLCAAGCGITHNPKTGKPYPEAQL